MKSSWNRSKLIMPTTGIKFTIIKNMENWNFSPITTWCLAKQNVPLSFLSYFETWLLLAFYAWAIPENMGD